MKNRTMMLAGALTLLHVTTAPVTAQNREHMQMTAELRILQEQTQQLALALAQLGESIQAINARLDDAASNTRKSFADQKLVIDELGNDLRVVRERTQENNARVGTLREEIEALRMSLLTRPAPAPAPVDPDLDPDAVSTFIPPPTFVPAPTPPVAGVSPERMYQTAWADYTSGQYTLAITGFEQFVRTFPQSERADDAQFLIGDAHYSLKRFEEAIGAYNQVIQLYPTGDQVAMAYYKRGLAQSQLGRTDAARTSWEEVLRSFPDSQEAVLARQNLDRLVGQSSR
jgi:tol-pal system protein YbgF